MATNEINFVYAQKYAQEIKNKTVLITGVTVGGVAFEAVRALCQVGARVIITGRSKEKLETAIKEVQKEYTEARIEGVQVDLSLVEKVKVSAQEIHALAPFIDVIINNAGAWFPTFQITAESHELSFATNYLSSYVLTNTLLSLQSGPSKVRIVNISSGAHRINPRINYDELTFGDGKTYDRWQAYGMSKTAVMLMAREIGKRWKGVTGVAVEPGLVLTQIITPALAADFSLIGCESLLNPDGSINPEAELWTSTYSAAASYIYAAFDSALEGDDGAYIEKQKVVMEKADPGAKDDGEAKKLWDETEKLLGVKFP